MAVTEEGETYSEWLELRYLKKGIWYLDKGIWYLQDCVYIQYLHLHGTQYLEECETVNGLNSGISLDEIMNCIAIVLAAYLQ